MVSIIIPSHLEKDINNMEKSCKLFFPDAQILIMEDELGGGKGFAIREGLKYATGDIVVFIDADIDIHPGEIQKLLPYINYYDVVIGVKRWDRLPPRRMIISLGYRLMVKLLFGLEISDSQTGLKIWKRDKIPSFTTDGFGFDIEMITKAHDQGLKIKEVPINCRVYSTVKMSSIIKTFAETIRIWMQRKKSVS